MSDWSFDLYGLLRFIVFQLPSLLLWGWEGKDRVAAASLETAAATLLLYCAVLCCVLLCNVVFCSVLSVLCVFVFVLCCSVLCCDVL